MRNRIIKLIGGWPKNEALTEAVKHLFNTIGDEDILKINGGTMTIAGKDLHKSRTDLIRAEAKQFLDSTLWKVLQNDIRYEANKAMFEKSKSESDIIAGKLWLYTLEVIKKRLESIQR